MASQAMVGDGNGKTLATLTYRWIEGKKRLLLIVHPGVFGNEVNDLQIDFGVPTFDGKDTITYDFQPHRTGTVIYDRIK